MTNENNGDSLPWIHLSTPLVYLFYLFSVAHSVTIQHNDHGTVTARIAYSSKCGSGVDASRCSGYSRP